MFRKIKSSTKNKEKKKSKKKKKKRVALKNVISLMTQTKFIVISNNYSGYIIIKRSGMYQVNSLLSIYVPTLFICVQRKFFKS
jgi:hypothetical protein